MLEAAEVAEVAAAEVAAAEVAAAEKLLQAKALFVAILNYPNTVATWSKKLVNKDDIQTFSTLSKLFSGKHKDRFSILIEKNKKQLTAELKQLPEVTSFLNDVLTPDVLQLAQSWKQDSLKFSTASEIIDLCEDDSDLAEQVLNDQDLFTQKKFNYNQLITLIKLAGHANKTTDSAANIIDCLKNPLVPNYVIESLLLNMDVDTLKLLVNDQEIFTVEVKLVDKKLKYQEWQNKYSVTEATVEKTISKNLTIAQKYLNISDLNPKIREHIFNLVEDSGKRNKSNIKKTAKKLTQLKIFFEGFATTPTKQTKLANLAGYKNANEVYFENRSPKVKEIMHKRLGKYYITRQHEQFEKDLGFNINDKAKENLKVLKNRLRTADHQGLTYEEMETIQKEKRDPNDLLTLREQKLFEKLLQRPFVVQHGTKAKKNTLNKKLKDAEKNVESFTPLETGNTDTIFWAFKSTKLSVPPHLKNNNIIELNLTERFKQHSFEAKEWWASESFYSYTTQNTLAPAMLGDTRYYIKYRNLTNSTGKKVLQRTYVYELPDGNTREEKFDYGNEVAVGNHIPIFRYLRIIEQLRLLDTDSYNYFLNNIDNDNVFDLLVETLTRGQAFEIKRVSRQELNIPEVTKVKPVVGTELFEKLAADIGNKKTIKTIPNINLNQQSSKTKKEWYVERVKYILDTPLILAIESSKVGDTHLMQKLIDKGADINFQGENTVTPVLCAVVQEDEVKVKYLIDKGYELSKKGIGYPLNLSVITGDKDKVTPIGVATRTKKLSLVKLLLQNGAADNELFLNNAAISAQSNNFADGLLLLILYGATIPKSSWVDEIKQNLFSQINTSLSKKNNKDAFDLLISPKLFFYADKWGCDKQKILKLVPLAYSYLLNKDLDSRHLQKFLQIVNINSAVKEVFFTLPQNDFISLLKNDKSKILITNYLALLNSSPENFSKIKRDHLLELSGIDKSVDENLLKIIYDYYSFEPFDTKLLNLAINIGYGTNDPDPTKRVASILSNKVWEKSDSPMIKDYYTELVSYILLNHNDFPGILEVQELWENSFYKELLKKQIFNFIKEKQLDILNKIVTLPYNLFAEVNNEILISACVKHHLPPDVFKAIFEKTVHLEEDREKFVLLIIKEKLLAAYKYSFDYNKISDFVDKHKTFLLSHEYTFDTSDKLIEVLVEQELKIDHKEKIFLSCLMDNQKEFYNFYGLTIRDEIAVPKRIEYTHYCMAGLTDEEAKYGLTFSQSNFAKSLDCFDSTLEINQKTSSQILAEIQKFNLRITIIKIFYYTAQQFPAKIGLIEAIIKDNLKEIEEVIKTNLKELEPLHVTISKLSGLDLFNQIFKNDLNKQLANFSENMLNQTSYRRGKLLPHPASYRGILLSPTGNANREQASTYVYFLDKNIEPTDSKYLMEETKDIKNKKMLTQLDSQNTAYDYRYARETLKYSKEQSITYVENRKKTSSENKAMCEADPTLSNWYKSQHPALIIATACTVVGALIMFLYGLHKTTLQQSVNENNTEIYNQKVEIYKSNKSGTEKDWALARCKSARCNNEEQEPAALPNEVKVSQPLRI